MRHHHSARTDRFFSRTISRAGSLLSVNGSVGIVGRLQIALVRSLPTFLRRAGPLDPPGNALDGHAGVVADRVDASAGHAGICRRAGHTIAGRDNLFAVTTMQWAGPSSFLDVAAKGFGVAIRISVGAPVFLVLAPVFSTKELSAAVGVQRIRGRKERTQIDAEANTTASRRTRSRPGRVRRAQRALRCHCRRPEDARGARNARRSGRSSARPSGTIGGRPARRPRTGCRPRTARSMPRNPRPPWTRACRPAAKSCRCSS